MENKDSNEKVVEIIKIGDTTYIKEGYGSKARETIEKIETEGKNIDAFSNKYIVKPVKKIYI